MKGNMNDKQSAVRLEGDLIITFDDLDRLIMENDKEFKKNIKIQSIITLDKDGKIINEEPAKRPQIIDRFVDDEEVARLMAEVAELRKNDPPMELPPLKQQIEEARQCYSEIRMFDYGLGKMSNRQAIADFYGWEIVDQILYEIEYSYNHKLDDRKSGQISKKLWQRMKDIRAGRLPKAERIKYKDQCKRKNGESHTHSAKNNKSDRVEKKGKSRITVKQRIRQKGDDYFLKTERGIIRNKTYRELFKGPGVVYEWLWANVVRSQWQDSEDYPIKRLYYDKGYLAYCSSYSQIGKDCGMSKDTVYRCIKKFVAAGVLETKLHVPKGKKRGLTVFILGTWGKRGKDIFEHRYRDNVFLSPKSVRN